LHTIEHFVLHTDTVHHEILNVYAQKLKQKKQ